MKPVMKAVGWVAAYFVLQLAVQLGFSALAVASGVGGPAEMSEWMAQRLLLASLCSNLLFLALALLFRRRAGAGWGWSEGRGAFKGCGAACIITFSFSMFFSLVSSGLDVSQLPLDKSTAYFSAQLPGLGPVLMAVNLLVLAPVAEEVLFRGILIGQLSKKYSRRASVLISALLFGFLHIMAGGPLLALGAVAMGALFGLVYIKTGSLQTAVVAHCAANLPDFVLLVLPLAAGWWRALLAAAMLAVCVAGLFLWYRPAQRGRDPGTQKNK